MFCFLFKTNSCALKEISEKLFSKQNAFLADFLVQKYIISRDKPCQNPYYKFQNTTGGNSYIPKIKKDGQSNLPVGFQTRSLPQNLRHDKMGSLNQGT